MFVRHNDRALEAIARAEEEARRDGCNYIRTEHILLGLIREGEGIAAKVLAHFGITREVVRSQVKEIVGSSQRAPSRHITYTDQALTALGFSAGVALELQSNYIRTEHILLGLIREGEGIAAQVLVKLGLDLDRVRQQVEVELGVGLLHAPQSPSHRIDVNAPLPTDRERILEELEWMNKRMGSLLARLGAE